MLIQIQFKSRNSFMGGFFFFFVVSVHIERDSFGKKKKNSPTGTVDRGNWRFLENADVW